jgi:hypothetical protein
MGQTSLSFVKRLTGRIVLALESGVDIPFGPQEQTVAYWQKRRDHAGPRTIAARWAWRVDAGSMDAGAGQTEDSDRITTIKLTCRVEHHARQ